MEKVDFKEINDEEIEKLFSENDKEIAFTNWYYITYNDNDSELYNNRNYQVNSETIGLNIERTETFQQALEYVKYGCVPSALK